MKTEQAALKREVPQLNCLSPAECHSGNFATYPFVRSPLGVAQTVDILVVVIALTELLQWHTFVDTFGQHNLNLGRFRGVCEVACPHPFRLAFD